MDKKTMGAFLSALRKANGYTQQEVADKLNVSNKTVSKWERDEGCPEIMMLPAIAELYDVTVDEILRGERIIKEKSDGIKEEKTEKRAKLIFDSAKARFTNLSIIAVSLGAVAVLIAYLLDSISYSYVLEWVGIMLVILMIFASIIIETVAFNSFKANFDFADAMIDENILNTGKRRSLLCLSITVMLSVISAVGLIFSVTNVMSPVFMLPVGIVLGGAVACLICWAGNKKLGLTDAEKTQLSPEFLKFRRKHINITSIIMVVVMVVSVAIPFADEFIDEFSPASYGFNYAVGYGYDSLEEAEKDYYKLKAFYEDGEPLYVVDYAEGDTYLWVASYTATVTHETYSEKTVYRDYDIQQGNYYGRAFPTAKETKEFKDNYCWDMEIFDFTNVYDRVSFDDETLSVSWHSKLYPYMQRVIDELPDYLTVGSLLVTAVAIVSYLVYVRRKKILSML